MLEHPQLSLWKQDVSRREGKFSVLLKTSGIGCYRREALALFGSSAQIYQPEFKILNHFLFPMSNAAL